MKHSGICPSPMFASWVIVFLNCHLIIMLYGMCARQTNRKNNQYTKNMRSSYPPPPPTFPILCEINTTMHPPFRTTDNCDAPPPHTTPSAHFLQESPRLSYGTMFNLHRCVPFLAVRRYKQILSRSRHRLRANGLLSPSARQPLVHCSHRDVTVDSGVDRHKGIVPPVKNTSVPEEPVPDTTTHPTYNIDKGLRGTCTLRSTVSLRNIQLCHDKSTYLVVLIDYMMPLSPLSDGRSIRRA